MQNIFPQPQPKVLFNSRSDAGDQLAEELLIYKSTHPIVLALPRGGVAVAAQVAKQLKAPLDVLVSRKIGSVDNAELGIGAISENNVILFDRQAVQLLDYQPKDIIDIINLHQPEVQRRVDEYRNHQPLQSITNRVVVLVDDGLATGMTAKAAIYSIKKLKPKSIVFAAPVCAAETLADLRRLVDDLICLSCPQKLQAISLYYQDFHQLNDSEVTSILEEHRTVLVSKN